MLLLLPTGTYSSTVENLRSLFIKCNNKKSIKIQWMTAHAGIKGNELADRLAKDAVILTKTGTSGLKFF